MPYERLSWQRPLDRLGRSIWRYMPWWKFEDLVSNHRLFFTRLRHIVDQEIDIFEGGLAQANFERPQVNVDWMLHDRLAPGQPPEIVDVMTRHYGDPEWVRRMQEVDRDTTFVNCWFTGEFESERMCQDYVPHGDGVVVQSTMRLLVASLHETPGSVQIDEHCCRVPDRGRRTGSGFERVWSTRVRQSYRWSRRPPSTDANVSGESRCHRLRRPALSSISSAQDHRGSSADLVSVPISMPHSPNTLKTW